MLPADQQPSEPRASVRIVARLDAATHEKVDDFAARFHQPRAAVVCAIMRWGLRRGQPGTLDGGASDGPVRHLYLHVDTALPARVAQAAAAAGVPIAPWPRQMVRQITLTDFPASWQADRSGERSHNSRIYDTRFMLRLDRTAQAKLQQLMRHVGASKANIIRQLIRQATPEEFPRGWHLRDAERCALQAPHPRMGSHREPRS
jgi:predicted transcriptional regulator